MEGGRVAGITFPIEIRFAPIAKLALIFFLDLNVLETKPFSLFTCSKHLTFDI